MWFARSWFVLPEGQALDLRSVAFGGSTGSGVEGTGKGTVATGTRARSRTLLSSAAFSDAEGDAHTCAHFFAFAPVLVSSAVGVNDLALLAITIIVTTSYDKNLCLLQPVRLDGNYTIEQHHRTNSIMSVAGFVPSRGVCLSRHAQQRDWLPYFQRAMMSDEMEATVILLRAIEKAY